MLRFNITLGVFIKQLILMVSLMLMLGGMASISSAVEVESINVTDSANVGGADLVLNGAAKLALFVSQLTSLCAKYDSIIIAKHKLEL
jgi:hypothetical protein